MNIKITSDSTCDLTPEIIKKYNISIIPLFILMDNKNHRDGIDIFRENIFSHVDNGGEICTTAAVTPAVYLENFTRFSQEYDAVIHINIGSKFSSCYQNACNIAEEFDNVYVVDSKNLSTGQGHIVLEAAIMAENNVEAKTIVEKLNKLADNVDASFIMNRLDYMRKGGRCSAVVEIGANIFNIKPCIAVVDGKMGVGRKYRGDFNRCVKKYVYDKLKDNTDIIYDRIFITHPQCSEEAVAIAKKAIEECGNFKEIIETRAGCTISSHCGPETLGVLFIRK